MRVCKQDVPSFYVIRREQHMHAVGLLHEYQAPCMKSDNLTDKTLDKHQHRHGLVA